MINNNFNLIRLFAALQVAIVHSASYLDINLQFLQFLNLFPGVPIFFFISGYLIIKSFRNSYKLKNFFYNRILRIYPGLYFCFFITVISIIISQYLKSDGLKMISSLNNKIIVQKDDVINLFSLKNEFESSRFIDCLSLHFFKIKRGDCLFIKDTSSAQKKYLYNLLESNGIDKKLLYRKFTTYRVQAQSE